MAELRLMSGERSGGLGTWLVRGCLACPFLIFGLEKFSTDPHWVHMFEQIGWGVWFRYFTGAVEVAGAVLLMIPRLAMIGILLLAGTMAAAVLIVAFILHSPAGSLFPAIFLAATCRVGIWWRGRLMECSGERLL